MSKDKAYYQKNKQEPSQREDVNTSNDIGLKYKTLQNIKYLPHFLHKNRFLYTLVSRGQRSCIYMQHVSAKTKCFEVFLIKTRPAKELFGKKYPAREVFPANEDFGYTAWSCNTLDRAKMRFINLENVKP
jgi:hypothetical protein